LRLNKVILAEFCKTCGIIPPIMPVSIERRAYITQNIAETRAAITARREAAEETYRPDSALPTPSSEDKSQVKAWHRISSHLKGAGVLPPFSYKNKEDITFREFYKDAHRKVRITNNALLGRQVRLAERQEAQRTPRSRFEMFQRLERCVKGTVAENYLRPKKDL
jgi:hypothetical protein